MPARRFSDLPALGKPRRYLAISSALALILLVAPFSSPALADCTTAGPVGSCTGSVDAGGIIFRDGTIHRLDIYGLTSGISGAEGSQLVLWALGKGGSGAGKGPDGESGAAGQDLDLKLSLGADFGIEGPSGISMNASGGDGHAAHEVSLGRKAGSGGSGANAGAVTLDVYGADGVASPFPISVSGGSAIVIDANGGDGGAGGKAVSFGGFDLPSGFGGAGGAGAGIDVALSKGSIFVQRDGSSTGVQLTSAGGHGGVGGDSIATFAGGDSGGSGGLGGDGGDVVFSAAGQNVVVTKGDYHSGVVVTSRGGNGGAGGGTSGVFKRGPTGGDGGDGGDATVTLSGMVGTSGKEAFGIQVHSVGGNGGNGAQGGTDGASGAGGRVALSLSDAVITTAGEKSAGVVLTSIGGFAGEANNAHSFFDKAEAVRSSSDGGAVTAMLSNTSIKTLADASIGFLAQSIGGGGGSTQATGGIFVFGGPAGQGGKGDAVTVTVDGLVVETQGVHSTGVSVASIGGGGGVAHSVTGLIALGGDGGNGGNGARVSFESTGGGVQVTTHGDLSDGLRLTSAGGGGGSGGGTVELFGNFSNNLGSTGGKGGSGGDVHYVGSAKDVITTSGAHSRGILLQSVGGGGGKGGSLVAVKSGLSIDLKFSQGAGKGTGTHHGGTIVAEQVAGSVTTSGHGATGILVQSVGGGGGAGGHTVTVAAGTTINQEISHGASGGAGGAGGKVDVKGTANVTTNGDHADGLLVQSVGGGGGVSSTVVNVVSGAKLLDGMFNHSLGSTNGSGGDAGAVTVTSSGTIATTGHDSSGLLAQSVAGGGGRTGASVNTVVGFDIATRVSQKSGGNGGRAGAVNVTNDGKITTGTAAVFDADGKLQTAASGKSSSAILAQSLGGGGGASGTLVNDEVAIKLGQWSLASAGGNGGSSGAVDVTNRGMLTTYGDLGRGISAQSLGGGGGVSSTLTGGTVSIASVDILHGGDGGDGGKASSVSVDNSGNIGTSGLHATGLLAQSVGGSGGASGLVVDGTVGVPGPDSMSAAITTTVGGKGGNGGSGGKVAVTNSGVVTTAGGHAPGIAAHSLGGNGGASGVTISATVQVAESNAAITTTIGGNGGNGGRSGKVSVTNSGALTTAGAHAPGIEVLSLGGNGGASGVTISAAVEVGQGSFAVPTTIGGDGGNASVSDDVRVTNETGSVITTAGLRSHGISAQSIGGNGGSAGFTLSSASQLIGSEGDDAYSTTLGGSGGAGSSAGKVTIDNKGAITTAGAESDAILAQSTGGNGGVGGTATEASLFGTAGRNFTVDTTIGGGGGGGSQGGAVSVSNEADLGTIGATSSGIYAQSIGGNGGKGGNSIVGILGFGKTEPRFNSFDLTANVNIGGSGGTGAHGGSVTVENRGRISTFDAGSYGIFAQSVGGGGGDGGNVYAGSFVFTRIQNLELFRHRPVKLAASFNLGGGGKGGGTGGSVSVSNAASISTFGETSYGIYAQSVGGGGGIGGNATSANAGQIAQLASDWQVSKLANEESERTIEEYQATIEKNKLLAREDTPEIKELQKSFDSLYKEYYSIFNKYNVSDRSLEKNAMAARDKIINIRNDIKKKYEDANKRIKGYIDNTEVKKPFSLALVVDIGGGAGSGGDGGDLTVDNAGSVFTLGDYATAIYSQTIGGGGGVGGEGTEWAYLAATVTGSSGGGGKGGAISVANTGSVMTLGKGAVGISAQSVGGGGGAAGSPQDSLQDVLDSLVEAFGSGVFGVSPHPDGAKGGDGGPITVTLSKDSSIATFGDSAHGLWLQSTGGGGGAAASSLGLKIGSAGLKGDSGLITADIAGSILVLGKGAHGIFAQSASGGDKSSHSGGVYITVSGQVIAAGEKSRAILAQASSLSVNDSMDSKEGVVTITIAEGGVVATTNPEAHETIAIMGGRSRAQEDGVEVISNRVSNSGTLRSAGSSSIVIGSDGKAGLRISNLGNLAGGIDVRGGDYPAELVNSEGGRYALGNKVDLGGSDRSAITNAGAMSAGGFGVVDKARITTGAFTQTATGVIQVDLAQTSPAATLTNDVITLDLGKARDTVNLSGGARGWWTGRTNFVNGDSGEFTFLKTEDGAALSAREVQMINSATVAYALQDTGDPTQLTSMFVVDYTGAGSGQSLDANALEFAGHFNSVMGSVRKGDVDQEKTDALGLLATDILNAPTGEAVEEIYGHHTLDESLISASRQVEASQAVHSLLQSCPILDPAAGETFYHQRECVWGQVVGDVFHQDETDSTLGFDEYTAGFEGAVQTEIARDTFIEAGGRVQHVRVDGSNFDQDGYLWSGGAAFKREVGVFTLSTTFGGGYYNYDQARRYAIGNQSYGAGADLAGGFVTAELRAYAVLPFDDYYAKPSIALAGTRLFQNGFQEDGSGPLNWEVDPVAHNSLVLSSSLELGRAFNWADHAAVGFVRAGVSSTLSGSNFDLASRLIGGSVFDDDVAITSSSDRNQFELAAGLNMDLSERLSLSLKAGGSISENTSSYGGYARMQFNF